MFVEIEQCVSTFLIINHESNGSDWGYAGRLLTQR